MKWEMFLVPLTGHGWSVARFFNALLLKLLGELTDGQAVGLQPEGSVSE